MTPTKRATSRLAALGHLRQVEVVLRAGRASDRAAAPVRSAWFRLLALLRTPPPDLWQQVRALLAPLALQCRHALAGELLATARWAHRQAVSGLRRSVPRNMLARVAARRRSHLRESIDWADLLAPFRQQADASGEEGSEDAPDVSLTDIGAILFPPPSDDLLARVLYGTGWQDRIAATSALGTPEQLASQVQAGLMLGHNPQQIARALLPHVEGVQSAARRVARTESMRVAGAMQMQAHAQLGDLVVGYQIHATLDERTRSWHAARSGTIYHANPGPGQKGYHQLPQPPDEAPDPAERPGGTPQTAYNCLLPGSMVQGAFLGGSKVRYAGQAVQVATALGATLRVTPNHPVLTPHGFVPAQRLRKGMHVVRYMPGVNDLANHEHDAPARVEDVFGALKDSAGMVSLWPFILDFHGDEKFVQGDVEVVLHERVLLGNRQAKRPKRSRDRMLVGHGVRAEAVPRLGTSDLALQGVRLSAPGFVRGSNLSPANLGIGDPGPLDPLRIGMAANIDTSRYEGTHQAEGLAVAVPFTATGDARFLRELVDRFAGLVSLDEIVEIGQVQFVGHVYDLLSSGGWIVSDAVFQSNCRCFVTPVLSDPGPVEGFTAPEPPDPLVMSDWWAGADEQRRRLAVGTRRYSLVLDQQGNAPDWEHFLSPTGGLMPTAELASERREDRTKRLEQVRAALAGRRRDARQVSQYGWP